MADQLAAGFLPAYGNALVHAPNLTRLAAQGTAVRERLLQLAAVCAVAGCDADRPAAVADRCLRQRGGAARGRAHGHPPAARRGLQHGADRKDALRRPRPAARLRAAADQRRLSGGVRLDARLAAARRQRAALVPQHVEPARHRACVEAAMQTDYDDEVCFTAPCSCCATFRGSRSAGRSSPPSRSPTRTIPGRCGGATGSSTTTTRSACRRWARSRASRPTRTACGCETCAAATCGRSATSRCGGHGTATTRRSATWTSGWARCWTRWRRPAWPTTRWWCSRPITARCWANAASGTRCRSSRARHGCR